MAAHCKYTNNIECTLYNRMAAKVFGLITTKSFTAQLN